MASKEILKLLLSNSRNIIPCSQFHTTSAHRSFLLKEEPYSPLWMTTLPKKCIVDEYGVNEENEGNNYKRSSRKSKKAKAEAKENEKINKSSKNLLISCKNEKFNFYKGTHYKKLSVIPLASKGWHHRKAVGDYFSVLPNRPLAAFLLPNDFEFKTDQVNECDVDEFKSLGISDLMIQKLKKMGIHYPTSIQLSAIPKILDRRHVLMTAETGCGKTLAYALPLLENILKLKPKMEKNYNTPFGVIVVPTRELAVQVGEVLSKLTQGLDIKCKVILANNTKQHLLNLTDDDVEKVDVVVCTLGVMCKLTYHNIYSLSKCIHLVIDEADTLLDDTFVDKLKVLLNRCRFITGFDPNGNPTGGPAQLSFVSATVPREAEKIIGQVFPASLMEKIKTEYLHKIPPHIRHNFVRCRKSDKPLKILELVKTSLERNEPVMIFSNKTATVCWLGHHLNENNIEHAICYSKMDSDVRLQNFQKFAAGEVNVLTCSDLGSRGHDITRVRHVVNYEFPKYMADYVHRCGRTGRIGNENGCQVTSFISSEVEVPLLMDIEKSVRMGCTLPHVNNNIARIISRKNENLE